MVEELRHIGEIYVSALLHGEDEGILWRVCGGRYERWLDGAFREDVSQADEIFLLVLDFEGAEEIVAGIDGKGAFECLVFCDAAELADVFLIERPQLILFCLKLLIAASLMLDGENFVAGIAQADSRKDA